MSEEKNPTSEEDIIEETVTEDTVEEVIAEAVTEEVIAEAVTEEVIAEAVAEEVIAEAVAEEVIAEAVAEEVIAEAVAEEVIAEAVAEEVIAEAVAEEVIAEAIAEEVIAEAIEEAVEEEDGVRYVEGPAAYVQRERRGRGRRIGSDIRVEDINYKNTMMLTRFLDPRGRILSRRKTKVPAIVQRRVVRAIKRARHLALLPYTADQTRIVRKRR